MIYRKDKTLRSSLFGKMVMFFLANVAGSYFVLSIREIPQNYPSLCTILGYVSQYTLLSMFFWMNALALRVYVTFRKMKPRANDNVAKNLLLFCLYAQGGPLLVCGLTALADAFGTNPELKPNMGEFKCFLSCHSGIKCSHTNNRFITPVFIYFGSVEMMINITNLLLFMATSYHLVQQWKQASKIQRFLLTILIL